MLTLRLSFCAKLCHAFKVKLDNSVMLTLPKIALYIHCRNIIGCLLKNMRAYVLHHMYSCF
jgi:hypothetical protein